MRSLPAVVLITDWSLGRKHLEGVLEQITPLGEGIALQHRHPEASGRLFLDEALWLSERCARGNHPLFINDRLDVALLVGAHIHLPSHGANPVEIHSYLPEHRWISASVHDASEASRAAGADLVLLSPLWTPLSKPKDARAPLGREGFLSLSERCTSPVYALGGIHPGRFNELSELAHGFALCHGIWKSSSPLQDLRALLRVPRRA